MTPNAHGVAIFVSIESSYTFDTHTRAGGTPSLGEFMLNQPPSTDIDMFLLRLYLSEFQG